MIKFLTQVPYEKFVMVYGEVGIWWFGLIFFNEGIYLFAEYTNKLTPSERVKEWDYSLNILEKSSFKMIPEGYCSENCHQ